MEFSKEFIEIFDHIGDKLGVAIDWSNKNVIPYLQELCDKYINWEIWTSVAWIVICVLLLILGIVSIKFAMKKHKEWEENGRSRYDTTKDISDISCVIGALLVIISVFVISVNVFEIIKCVTFPEMKIYEYITAFMET